MAKVTQTSLRKSEHIRINLEENVDSGITTGLERYSFPHQALPEMDLSEVDLSSKLLGREIEKPILISAMTGGSEEAESINRRLAEGAEATGAAMGVGSQRAAIEDSSLEKTFQVRQHTPGILLYANLGAIQLNYGYGLDECKKAVEMIEADALVLHLNALQEAVQPEGDTDFSGLLKKIGEVCRGIDVPVIIKEVGWGISGETALLLAGEGVAAIDVAGAGGTSWSQVEMHRAETKSQEQLAGAFVNWGIPTADAIIEVREATPKLTVIASGGLRNGVDIAKCLTLGADMGGMAGRFLKAAAISTEEVVEVIETTAKEIKISMFASGAGNIEELKQINLRKV
ncbi:MAG: type 2 isopentenyl-diphosphate Delta-isomerase [Anaerolineae bacterium]|nr:type 2 isopentenyl-diphosphate Delta-isomerase [Anaerolineae bacterium]